MLTESSICHNELRKKKGVYTEGLTTHQTYSKLSS
jgi:hypothetical protein